MAAGKVKVGYSLPYVALYKNTAGTISYESGQKLARGVEASYDIETSDDNNFYADNIEAESDSGTFQGGTLNLTVDGLLAAAEKLIMGLPTAVDGLYAYGDDQVIPDCGVGYIYEYQMDGVHYWTPIIFPRVQFAQVTDSGTTRGDSTDWQTQDLSASIKRAEDSNRRWRYFGEDQTTEAAAEAVIKEFLGI